MLKKKLTFLFIPGSAGSSKQLSIPVALIYATVTIAAVLVIANFFLSAQFFTDRVNSSELQRLRSENAQLKDKFEQMRWNLAEVQDRYQDLVQKEVMIRNMFDLPEINTEERQLGIGGPIPKAMLHQTETEKVATSTELEVDRLLRLSRYELQKYGEVEEAVKNVKDRLEHTPSIWPTQGWTSRGFGMKFDPFTGYKQMHRGIDVANRTGTPIIAPADGVVQETQSSNSGMGNCIIINHGYGFQTRYGHLSKIEVKRGQKVKRGDVIGLMGSTGYSTGPHLHYEVIRNGQFLNPTNYILNGQNDL